MFWQMQLVPPARQFQTPSPGSVPLPEPALLEPAVLESPLLPDEDPPVLLVPPPSSGAPPDAASPLVPPLPLALPASLEPLPAVPEALPPLAAPEAEAPPFAGSSLESELHAAVVATRPVKALASRKRRGRSAEEDCMG